MTVFGQLGNKQRPSTLESDWQCLSSFESHNLMIGACCILNDIQRYKPWYFCIKCFKLWKQYPGAWNWVHPQVILKCENLSLQLQRNPITRKPWPPSASWWPGFSWPNIFVEKWKKKRPPLAAINCFGDSYLNISKKICIDGVEIPSLSISAGYWP